MPSYKAMQRASRLSAASAEADASDAADEAAWRTSAASPEEAAAQEEEVCRACREVQPEAEVDEEAKSSFEQGAKT